ncbi:MAG: FecR family protein [Treponema sp.]|nr:FecR family protein [Treponema sp.]
MTKKKAKLKLIDFFIFASCLAIGAKSIQLFYNDLNKSTTRKDKETIGVITFKDKIAQRKYDDRIVWERIQTGTPLYDYDTVRTSDAASAVITFKDGTVIDINENTMLQVFKSKDGMGISVGDGNITVDTTNTKTNTSVDVAMNNGSKIVLESGSRLAAKSDSASESNSFNLQTGKANIVDSEGVQKTVNEGQSLKITGEGEVKEEAIAVNSISENLRLLSFDNEEQKVMLEWSVIEELKNEYVRVEVSTDKDFSSVSQTYTVKGNSSVEISAVPGAKLYWRIYPVNDKSNVFTGKISVDSVEEVKQVSPAYDSVIRYYEDLPPVNLTWTGTRFAEHYKLEVCDEVNFEKPLVIRNVSELSSTVNLPEDGTYYWRITPYYSLNETGYANPTELSKFTVSKNQALAKPELLLPRDEATLELDSKGKNVTFAWKANAKNVNYKVIVALDEDFSEPVFEGTTQKNRLVQKFDSSILEPENVYYWKVVRSEGGVGSEVSVAGEGGAENAGAAVSDGSAGFAQTVSSEQSGIGQIIDESDVRMFMVQEYIPGKNRIVFPPEGYGTEISKVPTLNFVWKLAEQYQNAETLSVLQISDKIDFSDNVQEIKTYQSSSSGLELKSGEYFWRVGVIPPDYIDPIAFTVPQSIKVLDELKASSIIKPENNSVHVVYGKHAVKVEWTNVEGADFYKVRLSNPATDTTIGEIQSVKDLSTYVYLPEGIYSEETPFKCTVQPVSEQTEIRPLRLGDAKESIFYARSPVPVKLGYPAENSKINGLTALRQKTEFSWETGDKPEKMRFILQKQMPSGAMKTVQEINASRQNLKLDRLSAGMYQWTVKASNGEMNLDARSFNRFTILPVETLDKPVITSLQKDTKLDLAYFKSHRNIVFEWQKVNGATDYEIALYQRNPNGTLRQITKKSGLSKPEYKFKDLSQLDNGTFEYQIRAFAHAKDGFEEQRSELSSARFKIEIELPKAVKTKDTGIMYGN